jgi:hypothetical protein
MAGLPNLNPAVIISGDWPGAQKVFLQALHEYAPEHEITNLLELQLGHGGLTFAGLTVATTTGSGPGRGGAGVSNLSPVAALKP